MNLNFTQQPMGKSSKFKPLLTKYFSRGYFTEKEETALLEFLDSYETVVYSKKNQPEFLHVLEVFLDKVREVKKTPFEFEPYHHRIKEPFDYYSFGLEFLRPLVDLKHSTVEGISNLDALQKSLLEGNNAILLANHQIEADPQAISLLLEKSHPQLAEEMIFVAGERVLTDPFAMPFSMGRNLLCIYSKKYIDNPPELKREKQLHNKKTMQLMSKLLSEGGKCIYVAPSGGRDRPDKHQVVQIAPFDPQSIEMFYLMSKKAKKKTIFYPLALKTYALLPPPATTQVELGESRRTHGGAIHLNLGTPIDMGHIPENSAVDKQQRRKARAEYICNLVKEAYAKFPTS